MSLLSHRIVISAPLARSVAIAALLGATFLANPLTAARADGVAAHPVQIAQAVAHPVAAKVTSTKAETVEHRITSLHAALKITPDEDAKWNDVAQAMRDNAAAMQKLTAAKSAQAAHGQTAPQDLQAYEAIAQAHLDGLKTLSSSFETLYGAMPDAQKKLADQVFRNANHKGATARG